MSRGRKSRKRRFSGRALAYLAEGILCLFVLAAAIYAFDRYAHTSDYFGVRQVRVEGARLLNPEYVVQVAGVTTEDNVVFLNIGRIRNRVESIPYVRQCRVMRAFPDTVVIRIDERQAVATLVADNHMFEVDEECVVLRQLGPLESYTRPFITEVGGLGFVESGQQLDATPVGEAVRALKAFQQTPLAQEVKISEIAATSSNTLRMFFDDFQYEVRWGRGDLESQAANFHALWAHLDERIACREYLDLRFGNDIACK